jgi:HAD superfamily hydrolase (TIGR01509 family)
MLIIFDCDGVLIDSEHIAARIESRAANSLGHPISEEEILEEFVGRPSRFIWEKVAAELGKDLPPDFLSNHKVEMARAFEKELEPITGISAALEILPFAKCVASSTEKSKLIINLMTTKLFGYFGDNVFSASQVERAKPFPDLFLFAAKSMGFAPKECLVIEDSVAGVSAARSANMTVIGFLGGSHIKSGHGEKLIACGAKAVFNTMDELNEIISSNI